MHELSIVMNIIEIATEELRKANGSSIQEIELDIGCLCSVEMEAFNFAWQQAIKNTSLENTREKINRLKGKAKCMNCNIIFHLKNLYDACPVCKGHEIEIIQGKELKVRSMIIS
jgi:hydrogenase nickel incorporation protein HypA/HybF